MKNSLLLLALLFFPGRGFFQNADSLQTVNVVKDLLETAYNLRKAGKHEEALIPAGQALDTAKRTWGKYHEFYAASVYRLATIHHSLFQFEKAEGSYLEAIDLIKKILGDEHPHFAGYKNMLALLYLDMGDYEKTEKLFTEILIIREKTLGKNDTMYADILVNLANIYYELGNYKEAKPKFIEAMAIREKALGKEHPAYAQSLNNLANLYGAMGHYAEAVRLHLQAKVIREKKPGKEHPDYAQTLNNLSEAYWSMGDYEKALPLSREAIAIVEKSLGREHPVYAWSLNNLAGLYARMGNYPEAELLFKEAMGIREKVRGKDHNDYAGSLSNLALLYLNREQYEKAEPLFTELSPLNQRLIIKASHHLSDRELNEYLKTFSAAQDQSLSLIQSAGSKSLASTCFDNALFYKGFLLNIANHLKRFVFSDTAATEKFNRLKSYERRLAAQYAGPINGRDSAKLDSLELAANSLKKDLARTVTGYSAAMRQVSWQEVQQKLKAGEAAVEFVHYRFYGKAPGGTDSTMYAVLVLRHGDARPLFVSLFEEKELAPILHGATGGNHFLKINGLYAQKPPGDPARPLYDLVWEPLEELLAGSQTVYSSSSGLLHRINLAAIPAGNGQAFGDRHVLVSLGSTRQLVVPEAGIPAGTNDAYLAGGIRYHTDSVALARANRAVPRPGDRARPDPVPFRPDTLSVSRGGVLDYLPASVAEVREIERTMIAAGIRVKVDTGFFATEESFRRQVGGAPSPRIVHLATHGYFFPDRKGKTGGSGPEPVFRRSDHPMIRSGLILAGAAQAWISGRPLAGFEDGILTAYEICQMDLSNTELVVMSACETGLGDIVGNEGVYGLQRAFRIAGAKYLVMSLWKVDDRSTQEFMTAFYRHWLTGKQPIPQAFRQAQREIRAKRPGAYDWAGFVLIE
jgi:CHAT domain-containing protein/tetratricopeptide (TPR) repeat protein